MHFRSAFVLLLAFSFVGCSAVQLREQPEAVAIVQRQLDAYNARDLRSFVATYSDDVLVYRAPSTTPVISGKEKLSEFYQNNRFNHPNLHAKLLHRSVVGSKVIDHERITGLRDEPVDAVAAYIVEDGLIQSVWLFYAD